MADVEDPQQEVKNGGRCCGVQCTRRRKAMCACGSCCCCLFFIWCVLVIAIAFVGSGVLGGLDKPSGHQAYHPDKSLVDIHDVLTYEWWPGCEGAPGSSLTATANFTNCGAVCCKCSMVPAFRTFNTQNNYSHVTFRSREGPDNQEVVTLTGWWLPAGPPGGPIVVLQHGLGGTVNSARPQTHAYLVRSAGFNVLLVNLRNHGTSGQASHNQQSWGFDYPYDLLGAWDYAVNDPDGVLGGPRSPSQVGLMGFSMGGFTAASAFGLEHRAPGLWLDGAITDPRELLLDTIEGYIGFLAYVIVVPAWPLLSALVGVPMRANLPAETLPTGPSTQRPVMVVQSPDDTSVKMDMAKEMVEILSEGNRYKVSTEYNWGGACGSNDHNMLAWIVPREYTRKLCTFWSGVFSNSSCTAPDLVF